MLTTLFTVISAITVLFLLLPFGEVLCSLLLPKKKKETGHQTKSYDFGLIITAYKNVDISIPLVESLLQQSGQNFVVYLVADACHVDTFPIEDKRLVVLNPRPSLNLKVKSIIHAVDHFQRPHDFIGIFDADNLAHPDFLKEIQQLCNSGYQVVQGQRTAKNLNSLYACADATGEFYKNYIERYLPFRLGSSAVISGSGMVVEAGLYKAYLQSPEIQQGQQLYKRMLQEDKILQNFLLRQNIKIAYAWDAIVYDEKVTTADAVSTQRSRWLYSYFQNIPNVLGLFRRSFLNRSFNQFWFALITISPPLFILVFATILLAMAGLFIQPGLTLLLVISLGLFFGNILLTLYLSKVPPAIWRVIWGLPLFVWQQIKGLFKMFNPDKNFKPTEHQRAVKIDDLVNGTDHKE